MMRRNFGLKLFSSLLHWTLNIQHSTFLYSLFISLFLILYFSLIKQPRYVIGAADVTLKVGAIFECLIFLN